MTPERYQRVVKIFQTASQHRAEARQAFLAEACAGDDNLRREVEAMLAADAQSGGFLDKPADDLAAAAVTARESQSFIGRRISHYEVISLLGAGGMGEVYRARDSTSSQWFRIGRRLESCIKEKAHLEKDRHRGPNPSDPKTKVNDCIFLYVIETSRFSAKRWRLDNLL